ncbi:hypothetical protein KBB96_17215 [Luteolibacter ambystomatis]|uniref:Uncharacterized protein n=1 Tax=Luteolibacter ambystomatis TaxID=2824561 RepID=A0A975G950_9BACT|nr:hypothetical protein [Luteolibacter ambystomatis]QUE50590.1 hypothetical protein KBB96_17215 [Luteolibacter ambystomatis]
MKKALPACFVLLTVTLVQAEERPTFYPFDVTLGGVKAEMKPGNTLFAEVPKPVTDDAVLALDHEVPMLIVNAFPCKEDGSVEETQAVGILYAQKVKQVKLDATMDKKKLPPGNYLANVVADGKTSRIVFTVAPAESKVKTDFSKVLGFLKKKAGLDK